jgi:hypothetical protein
MEKTALTKLENWITKFEKIKGTPTICEIKAQINMFKEIEKEQIEKAVIFGNRQDFYDVTEEIGSNYYNSTYTQS